MLVSSEKMLKEAQQGHYAVPAPDFWDQNSCRTFCRVSQELKMPLILSYAENLESALSIEEAASIGRFYAVRTDTPIVLHLDHGTHIETIEEALKYGFTSVMIDASGEAYEENVKRTKAAAELAHAAGAVIEAEIGSVGSAAAGLHAVHESVYTEVGEAASFVEEAEVDSLAVSIGTSHGLYTEAPNINFVRLEELRKAVSVPLVLHGGSSTGDENLNRCTLGGITKVNLFTDFIVAAIDTVYAKRPDNWLSVLKVADGAVADVLRHYYKVFNCIE